MNDMMGLIYTSATDTLGELTALRSTAALPVCARYRVIDFMLSSLVSSGARNVGIIMQKNYHSLMEHLGSGKEWDLHGKHQGLAILPPFLTRDNVGVYGGFMDAVKNNLTYLRQCRERYVLITETGMVYSARYDDMLKQHIKTGADVTLMYTDDPGVVRTGNSGRYLDVDVNGRVKDIEVEPSLAHYRNTFMECFLIRRELLIDLVDRALSRAQYHFVRDVLISALRDGSLKVYGWRNPGKVWKIDTVQAYFNCSMELLNPEVRKELFSIERPVWGKQRDDMPTRHAEGAVVKNSIIADGCIIEGTVENCILFRGVRVQKGAVVKNAIVMQDGYIMSNTELENCILDKGVIVREGTRLIAPATYPNVVGKNMII